MLIEPLVLKGFRDFLPSKALQRQQLQRSLENTFEQFGFLPIDTPVLEYKKVLLGKGGGETDKQIYEFTDRGKREVAMRFDLTVPFARFMAAHSSELYLPFKRYHIGKVWRGENTQKGRFREFIQCDFDIVGVDNSSSDFEILFLMYHSFITLGINNITIKLAHRGIFNRFLNNIGAADQSVEIMRGVDKINKIGKEKVLVLLSDLITEKKAAQVLEYIKPEESFLKTLEKIITLSGGSSPESDRLTEIHSYIEKLGIQKYFVLDPSITRGLDYYTGIVFETFLNDFPSIGSVCSGGRYNNLASLYTKQELPGVGSSIGLDRLIAAMDELKILTAKTHTTDSIVLCMNDKDIKEYHHVADQFRTAGLSCEVFLIKKKLSAQFSFAEKKGIPIAILCGEDEIREGKLSIRNLRSRESWNMLTFENALDKCKEILKDITV